MQPQNRAWLSSGQVHVHVEKFPKIGPFVQLTAFMCPSSKSNNDGFTGRLLYISCVFFADVGFFRLMPHFCTFSQVHPYLKQSLQKLSPSFI